MPGTTNGGTEFDPAALERTEARFWREIWDAVPTALGVAKGVRAADFGPIQATVTKGQAVGLDFLLGAGQADLEDLRAAVEWARGSTSNAIVPILSTDLERRPLAAELTDLGFEESSAMRKFLRDSHPARFPAPDGVEVVEVVSPQARFGQIISTAFELPSWTASIFDALPGRTGWRCYAALIDEQTVGAATLFLDQDRGHLGSAGVLPLARGRKCHLALLRRRIDDAIAANVRLLATDIELGTDPGDRSSANLLKAGFRPAYVRPVWTDARPAAG